MRKKQPKPGTVIPVKVGGVEYETVIDEHREQRFKANGAVEHIYKRLAMRDDGHELDMNGLRVAYHEGKFNQRDYAEYHMMIGYSVSGFSELSPFQDMKIENPLWEEPAGMKTAEELRRLTEEAQAKQKSKNEERERREAEERVKKALAEFEHAAPVFASQGRSEICMLSATTKDSWEEKLIREEFEPRGFKVTTRLFSDDDISYDIYDIYVSW